ncbi:coiled-coil domain-containing protein [Humisphaera borealis]|uniref:Uncharacterized protein n=1 Tax=Humisphaera borealis TaxID=2807512 RepID=A0A7M2X2N2_9BACT|nr:hypothetical protein [Humisphaera borealis]QOV91934.1 hypothetical protein IPV69_11505 [Humisphaera borealis]
MQMSSKKMWVLGAAVAAAINLLPISGVSFQSSAVGAPAYEDVVGQINEIDRQILEAEGRFAKQTAGMNKGGRQYKQLQAEQEQSLKQLRNQKAKLREQAENARKQQGAGAVAGKLENNAEAIANEKKRHAEALKRMPAGSAAAQNENQRFEDRMRELTTRRADLKEDVAAVKEVRQSTEAFKKDVSQMNKAIAGEKERHAKAMKFLPANSLAAQEEQRAHEQKLRQIQDGYETAGDKREMTIAKVSGGKAVDGELDNINTQIANEKARHDRRMAQVMNGSAAAAEENRLYAENMARLSGRQAELQNAAAGSRYSAEQKFALKRQLDELDQAIAAENDRFQRRLNDIDAGSEIERLERQRHATALADLNNRKAVVVAQINGTGPAQASGQ